MAGNFSLYSLVVCPINFDGKNREGVEGEEWGEGVAKNYLLPTPPSLMKEGYFFSPIHRTFAVRQGLAVPGGLDTHPS